MGADKSSPRDGMTRRVLFTVGGLTLLGICATDEVQQITASAAQPKTSRDAINLARALTSAAPADVRAPAKVGRRAEVRAPAVQAPMDFIHDGRKAIALTIDDGPSPVYTPQVLKLLAKYRITASFSMIGLEARSYPRVAREVADAGHLIVNHTWTHLDLAVLPPALVIEQMDRATEAIHAATGRTPDMFRAPYGAWSPYVLQRCAQTRMTPLGWSVDPRDWSRPGVAAIVANIMDNTRTGSIILEHDGGGNRAQTVAALKIVIPRLLAEGYHFRTP